MHFEGRLLIVVTKHRHCTLCLQYRGQRIHVCFVLFVPGTRRQRKTSAMRSKLHRSLSKQSGIRDAVMNGEEQDVQCGVNSAKLSSTCRWI